MSNIAVFFGIAAVLMVYCGVFWDRRYRCSLLQHPTAMGHKTATIQSFSSSKLDIAVVEKNTAICDLQWHLYDHRNRDSFLRYSFLVIAASQTAAIDLLTPCLSLNLPFFFFFFFIYFSFLTKTLYLSISFHSISLTLRRPKTHYSLYLSLPLQGPKIPPKHPAQTLFIFRTLFLSLFKTNTQNPTIVAAFTTTPPPPPTPNAQWMPSRNPNPPRWCHLASPIHLVTTTSFHSQKPNALSVSCLKHSFCFFIFILSMRWFVIFKCVLVC